MKTIIAGSRTIINYDLVCEEIEKLPWKVTEIVEGGAKGVDSLGFEYAMESNIPVKSFPANWEKFGKYAGPLRNEEMANYADCLLAIWDGESSGTFHMYSIMNRLGKPLRVVFVKNNKVEKYKDLWYPHQAELF